MNHIPTRVHKYAIRASQDIARMFRSDNSHLDRAATLARVEECPWKIGEAAASETLNASHHPPIQLPYKLGLRPVEHKPGPSHPTSTDIYLPAVCIEGCGFTSRATPLNPMASVAAFSTERPPATLPVNDTKLTTGCWTTKVASSGDKCKT